MSNPYRDIGKCAALRWQSGQELRSDMRIWTGTLDDRGKARPEFVSKHLDCADKAMTGNRGKA